MELLSSSSSSSLVGLLNSRTSKRARQLITAYTVGQVAWELGSKIHREVVERREYTIRICDSNSVTYDLMLKAVLDLLPEKDRRSLLVHVFHERVDGFNGEVRSAKLKFDGRIPSPVMIHGHRIMVSLIEEGAAGTPGGPEIAILAGKPKMSLVLKARGRAAAEALLDWTHEVLDARLPFDEFVPQLVVATPWGDWVERGALIPRSPESVILRDGQMERLLIDVHSFLEAEEIYEARGIPYHRGLLLEGPPRTGKSSVARALASRFRLSLYYLSLSDVDSDVTLIKLVSQIPRRSILLLEDVDITHAATERTERNRAVSMSGLLNVLDGVITPHGLIAIMTSNHMERLDPALIGPGRVDRIEHIGHLTDEQFGRLATLFYPDHDPTTRPKIGDDEIAPAAVVEIFKRHLDSSRDAFAEIFEFCLAAEDSEVESAHV